MDVSKMYNNKNLSDVVFCFEDGSQIYAHRSILCCVSPYFETMFISSGMLESLPGNQLQIPVKDFPVSVYEKVLSVCYGIPSELNVKVLVPVFEVAQMFMLKELMKKCITFVMEYRDNFYEFIIICNEVFHANCDDLLKACILVLSRNCPLLVNHPTLLGCLEEGILILSIQSDFLKAKQQLAFTLVIEWGKMQASKKHMSVTEIITKPMECIEFDQLDTESFYNSILPHVDILPPLIVSRALKSIVVTAKNELDKYKLRNV